MKIFVTGGCGYVGTVLTNAWLIDGHNLVVLDTQWFGNYLKKDIKIVIIGGKNNKTNLCFLFNFVFQ